MSGCAFLPGAGPSITLDAFELEAESLALDLTGVAADVECGSGSIPFEAPRGASTAVETGVIYIVVTLLYTRYVQGVRGAGV